MTYTVIVLNYSYRDYNEPAFKKDFTDLQEATKEAESRFGDLAYGRVTIAPLNPETGYHDLPAVWDREKSHQTEQDEAWRRYRESGANYGGAYDGVGMVYSDADPGL